MKKKRMKKEQVKKERIKKIAAFLLIAVMMFIMENYISLVDPEQVIDGDIPTVHFISVGQGDSTLITGSGGSVLIDAGETEYGGVVADYLRKQGISTLDYVVATHPHSDHIGGLAEVINGFDVENVMAPKVTANSRAFERFVDAVANKGLTVTSPTLGDTFTLSGIKFTILAPSQINPDDLNNCSIVLKMDYNGTSFIFMGDAESASEKAIIAGGFDVSADVLKLGHHGSRTSSTSAFLDAVFSKSEAIGIISCGKGNSYGHPHSEVMDALDKREVTVYRTDIDDTIVLTADGKRQKE